MAPLDNGTSDTDYEKSKGIPDGLYIHGAVNDKDVLFVLDTGGPVSLLSKSIYDKLKEESKPKLEAVTARLSTASGKPLACYGKATFSLKMGMLEGEISMIVADITDDVLLGSDFLISKGRNKVDLLLNQNVMVYNGISVMLERCYSKPKICKVTLADSYLTPANTEVVVNASPENCSTMSQPSVIEPVSHTSEKYRSIMNMAPCLVMRLIWMSL